MSAANSRRLTDAIARKALPSARGAAILWDAEVKGFGLRLSPGGGRSFVLDYRAEGRQHRITIGAYPDWSLAAAREAAKAMKREVDLGRDPMSERHVERAAPTVPDLWERYRLEHLPTKAARSQKDETMMWEQIVLPRFGKMKVAAISHEDIDDLHRDITTIRGTPIRANRMVEVLRKAFNLSIRWKWRTDNPASGVRRNPEEKRNRYLNKVEVAALARALQDHSEPVSANAIKLLMLTGARRGEVLGATWATFDLENGIWTKPSAHTKQRKLHRVPLSRHAVRLLEEIKETAKGPYVFPGADGKPLTDIKRDVVFGLQAGRARREGRKEVARWQGHAGPQRQADRDRGAERASPRSSAFLGLDPRLGRRFASLDRANARSYAGADHAALCPSFRRSDAQGCGDGRRLRAARTGEEGRDANEGRGMTATGGRSGGRNALPHLPRGAAIVRAARAMGRVQARFERRCSRATAPFLSEHGLSRMERRNGDLQRPVRS
jgi:integrase